MHDFIRVTIGDGRQQLFHVIFGFVFSDGVVFDDSIEEFSSTAVFHDDVDEGFLDVDIVNTNDVGMVLAS